LTATGNVSKSREVVGWLGLEPRTNPESVRRDSPSALRDCFTNSLANVQSCPAWLMKAATELEDMHLGHVEASVIMTVKGKYCVICASGFAK